MGDAGATRDGTRRGCVEEVVEVRGCGRVRVRGDYEGKCAGAERVERELQEARDGVTAGRTGRALVRNVGLESGGECEGAERQCGVGEEEKEVCGACFGECRGRCGRGCGEAGPGLGEPGFEVGDLGVEGRGVINIGVSTGAHWRDNS